GEGNGTGAAATSDGAAERPMLRLRWPRRRRPRPGIAASGPERRMLQGPASTGAEGEAPVSAEIPPAIRALRARRRRRRKPGAAHGEPALQPQTPTETNDPARTGENSGWSGNTAAGQELPARPSRSRHRRRQRTGS